MIIHLVYDLVPLVKLKKNKVMDEFIITIFNTFYKGLLKKIKVTHDWIDLKSFILTDLNIYLLVKVYIITKRLKVRVLTFPSR